MLIAIQCQYRMKKLGPLGMHSLVASKEGLLSAEAGLKEEGLSAEGDRGVEEEVQVVYEERGSKQATLDLKTARQTE